MDLGSQPTNLHLDQESIKHLRQWEGRAETVSDDVSMAPMAALSATLDRDDPKSMEGLDGHRGIPLPPLWHWLYFLPHYRQGALGTDGHPPRGGFLPPVPLPRRMWAGGRLAWIRANPLLAGQKIDRVSRIESVSHKPGRSGELVFLSLRHEIRNGNGLAVMEEQDIVYRGAPQQGDPIPPPALAEANASWRREYSADTVLLFRYSALTFNGHRIHYDRPYAIEVEGYEGLVVHGPLIATLLADLVYRNAPEAQMVAFQFRAQRPIFDQQPFYLNGEPSADGKTVRLWASDHDGFLAMQATATLA